MSPYLTQTRFPEKENKFGFATTKLRQLIFTWGNNFLRFEAISGESGHFSQLFNLKFSSKAKKKKKQHLTFIADPFRDVCVQYCSSFIGTLGHDIWWDDRWKQSCSKLQIELMGSIARILLGVTNHHHHHHHHHYHHHHHHHEEKARSCRQERGCISEEMDKLAADLSATILLIVILITIIIIIFSNSISIVMIFHMWNGFEIYFQ